MIVTGPSLVFWHNAPERYIPAIRASLAAARSDGNYGGRRPSLSSDDVATAKALLAKGEPMEKLIDRFGVSRATLYNYGLRKHPPTPTKPTPKREPPKKR